MIMIRVAQHMVAMNGLVQNIAMDGMPQLILEAVSVEGYQSSTPNKD
jgi:hypothetical protein